MQEQANVTPSAAQAVATHHAAGMSCEAQAQASGTLSSTGHAEVMLVQGDHTGLVLRFSLYSCRQVSSKQLALLVIAVSCALPIFRTAGNP